MERLQVRQPTKRRNLKEVLPENLDRNTSYLIESYRYSTFDLQQFKGTFLESITINNTIDPPVIESSFQIQEFCQELAILFRGDEHIGSIEKFRNDRTRYYLPEAQEIMNSSAQRQLFANMINTQQLNPTEEDLRNTNNDLGKDLANKYKEYFGPAKKGGTKRKTKRTKRTKRPKGGTKRKTKRTKRAKKGTKTKRTTKYN